jgi:hypothetical protein
LEVGQFLTEAKIIFIHPEIHRLSWLKIPRLGSINFFNQGGCKGGGRGIKREIDDGGRSMYDNNLECLTLRTGSVWVSDCFFFSGFMRFKQECC